MYWINNLCRICAQISDVCFPIFDKINHDLEIKIKKCLSLELSEEDFKPKEICNICISKITDFYDLINICHESNYKFESILYSSLHNPEAHELLLKSEDISPTLQLKDNFFNVGSTSAVHVSSEYNNENNFCDDSVDNLRSDGINLGANETGFCENLVENPSVLRHSGNCTNINSSVVSMSCFQSSNKKGSNENHNRLEVDISDKGPSACAVEIENCSVNVDYGMHENPPTSSPKQTSVNKTSQNPSKKLNIICVKTIKFAVNNSSDQKPKEKPRTNFISTEFRNRNIVKRPRNAIKPQYTCPKCNKIFKHKMTLKVHLAKHSNYRPFVCQVCQKAFVAKWELTLHSRIHTSQFQCNFCSKTFTVPSKLERHIRIHTNSRPFRCDFADCGRSFSDKRNLDGHKVMHSDVKKYLCSICQKSYKMKKQLKEHELSHRPDRFFACNMCDKVYKWKATLTQHMKKHTGYNCKKCNKDLGKLSLLIKHRKECDDA